MKKYEDEIKNLKWKNEVYWNSILTMEKVIKELQKQLKMEKKK